MEIIDFKKAKARIQSKEKAAKHLPKTDNWESELLKPYYELAQLCEKFYDRHD
ncbi:MAG: hypothetical protein HFH82_14495 [Lachnospiraceae bacterium]|nr:hypothetical protein [Lachnospiraceae bacterium]